MKIGLVGTHSTGKTTLAHFVSETYGIPYARSDIARDIGRRLTPGLRLDQFSPQEQWQLQQQFLRYANDIQYMDSPFITDCCSVTCDPYSRFLIGNGIKDLPGYDQFLAQAYGGTRQLTRLFYIPAESDLVLDGFRPHSEQLRTDIDAALLECLVGFQFYILTGTIERRAEQVALSTGKTETSIWNNYVAFEGLPGSGKSTLIKRLVDTLRKRRKETYVCQRFGTPNLKEELTSLYEDPVANRDQLLELHAASFMKQFERNIVHKRLEERQLVITDRQKFTAVAIQLALGNSHANCYKALREIPTPGRVIYLDIDPALAVSRRKREKQGNSLETDLEFQHKVRNAYQWLSNHHLEFRVVNANRPVEDVERQVISSLDI